MRLIVCLILCACAATAQSVKWVHEGPRATFAVNKDGLSTSGRGGPPNWLRTEAEYENFRLQFEYKLAQWAEAAVILRAPRAGAPMRAGLAIFLAHDFHENVTPYVTGAIAGVLPPAKRPATTYEGWHAVEIECDGPRLRVAIDGAGVQDVRLDEHPELKQRLRRGFIGFPDLGHAYAVRNVELKDLGSREKYVELFDGRTLAGWRVRGESGQWAAREGAIAGANGHSILYADPVFRDFELTALVRSHSRVNSGVFLRGSPELKEHRGFEVQVYSPADSVYPTGSVYGKQRSRITADFEERWFLLQVRVEGSRCAVRVDGETVAEYDSLSGRDLQPGRVGLQIHLEDAWVEFRDLRVRPL